MAVDAAKNYALFYIKRIWVWKSNKYCWYHDLQHIVYTLQML